MPLSLPDGPPSFADFPLRLLLDLLAVAIFTRLIYFRRHARRDLFLVFTSFNLGLFVVLTVIVLSSSAAAIGFGLFAMLSIIRLRSEPFSNVELGYFFSALVLALINGVPTGSLVVPVGLDALVLGAMYLLDHPALVGAAQHRHVILDSIFPDDAVLKKELEERLGVRILGLTVTELDYVKDITRLDIRFVDPRRC
jgi:hypothetical protein